MAAPALCPRPELRPQTPPALSFPPQREVGGQTSCWGHPSIPLPRESSLGPWEARGAPWGRRAWLRALDVAARPGRHYTAVGRGASLGVPEGVPAADAPGEGTARHKARFVLCSPRELEPMDWRQLRSSVRQRRGSGPGKGLRGRGRMGPRGSVCAGPLTRLHLPGTLRQVAPPLRASVYPSAQPGRLFLLCPPLWTTVPRMEAKVVVMMMMVMVVVVVMMTAFLQ